MSIVSYAQNFEDVMLWRALKHIKNGFYVDVGAQDPVFHSVSKLFYDKGWRGINIEPVHEYAELLRRERPGETTLEMALSDKEGMMDFNVISGTGLSTAISSYAEGHRNKLGLDSYKIKIPVLTLNSALSSYIGKEIHWLKIDVEGMEQSVLKGWDSKIIRPWIIVIEATVPTLSESTYLKWENILIEARYKFVYSDKLNRFYIANEHLELSEFFSYPPGIFDEFSIAPNSSFAGQVNHIYQLKEIELKNKIREAEMEAEHYRKQVSLIKETISWRITAPFRWILISHKILFKNMHRKKIKINKYSNPKFNEGSGPLVTVVTVTFNLIKAGRENFFRQCLESVHDQTYKNIEHVVVDGGSKDGTLELIEEYVSKGWISYLSEPDNGIFDAMNKGIKLAKGKYITFLNSDDYYHNKEGIVSSVEALEGSNADFSYAPIRMINMRGIKINHFHPHCAPDISSVFFGMPFSHQTMFTRRDVIIKEGMFNTIYKSASDYDFIIRLCLKKYKSVFVNKIFASFRSGGFSDVAYEQSLNDVTSLYFKNYSNLCHINEKECRGIIGNGFNGIPKELAKALKDFSTYFNYDSYKKSRTVNNIVLSKIKRIVYLTLNRLSILFFSPKEFTKKCLRRLPVPIKRYLKKF